MTQRARETQRRLVVAAGELFHEQGIRASGIEAIIGRAGVTKMTLYAHFDSKDELVAAYLAERDRRWREYLEDVLDRHGKPEERLVQGGMRGCDFVNFSAEFPELEHPGRAVVREHKAEVRRLLTELVTELGAEDSESLAEHLFMVLEGAYITGALESDEEALGRARLMAESLIRRYSGSLRE
jgi:AcrR family transcriptional regulator